MGNETTKTPKPPKYIMHDGYLYERVPKKKIKEGIIEYNDLQQMLFVASGGKRERDDMFKKIAEMMGD